MASNPLQGHDFLSQRVVFLLDLDVVLQLLLGVGVLNHLLVLLSQLLCVSSELCLVLQKKEKSGQQRESRRGEKARKANLLDANHLLLDLSEFRFILGSLFVGLFFHFLQPGQEKTEAKSKLDDYLI